MSHLRNLRGKNRIVNRVQWLVVSEGDRVNTASIEAYGSRESALQEMEDRSTLQPLFLVRAEAFSLPLAAEDPG